MYHSEVEHGSKGFAFLCIRSSFLLKRAECAFIRIELNISIKKKELITEDNLFVKQKKVSQQSL